MASGSPEMVASLLTIVDLRQFSPAGREPGGLGYATCWKFIPMPDIPVKTTSDRRRHHPRFWREAGQAAKEVHHRKVDHEAAFKLGGPAASTCRPSAWTSRPVKERRKATNYKAPAASRAGPSSLRRSLDRPVATAEFSGKRARPACSSTES